MLQRSVHVCYQGKNGPTSDAPQGPLGPEMDIVASRHVRVLGRVDGFATGNIELWHGPLLWLDARELNHLCPLLGVISYQFSELSRRHRLGRSSQTEKLHFHFRISDDGVDLIV
jgi:hypothetical protein